MSRYGPTGEARLALARIAEGGCNSHDVRRALGYAKAKSGKVHALVQNLFVDGLVRRAADGLALTSAGSRVLACLRDGELVEVQHGRIYAQETA